MIKGHSAVQDLLRKGTVLYLESHALIQILNFLECWVLRGSILHGHAGIHHNQRPIHAGYTVVWRISGNKHPSLAQVDAVFEHGPLCLPEHADCRIQ